jgi:hypothetical protein
MDIGGSLIKLVYFSPDQQDPGELGAGGRDGSSGGSWELSDANGAAGSSGRSSNGNGSKGGARQAAAGSPSARAACPLPHPSTPAGQPPPA